MPAFTGTPSMVSGYAIARLQPTHTAAVAAATAVAAIFLRFIIESFPPFTRFACSANMTYEISITHTNRFVKRKIAINTKINFRISLGKFV